MKDGSSIEYVEECVHFGNTIYSDISLKCIDNSVSDLFIRTNFKCQYILHCMEENSKKNMEN